MHDAAKLTGHELNRNREAIIQIRSILLRRRFGERREKNQFRFVRAATNQRRGLRRGQRKQFVIAHFVVATPERVNHTHRRYGSDDWFCRPWRGGHNLARQ